MNKTAKSIIGLSAAVVVLGGGLAALMLTEPKENENTDSSVSSSEESSVAEGSGIVLIQDEKATEAGSTVKEVTVKNADGTLHVVMDKAPTDESAATYTHLTVTKIFR